MYTYVATSHARFYAAMAARTSVQCAYFLLPPSLFPLLAAAAADGHPANEVLYLEGPSFADFRVAGLF